VKARATPGTKQTADVETTASWEQLWFALTRGEWASLAIVPVTRGPQAIGVARALAEAGQRFQADSVDVVDAGQIAPGDVAEIVRTIEGAESSRRRVLIALGAPLTNPAAIPVGRAVDAAVLLVSLGKSELKRARQTMASVGSEHFAGSIAVVE
jgi:hypothetical protein